MKEIKERKGVDYAIIACKHSWMKHLVFFQMTIDYKTQILYKTKSRFI